MPVRHGSIRLDVSTLGYKYEMFLNDENVDLLKLKDIVRDINDGVDPDVYFIHKGRLVSESSVIEDGVVHAVLRLKGGKGGFGSMLRAIGAQIEKTTNREACRDLSGRRLRDINEEKRLKTWIAQQAERERLAAEKREQKLKKLCAEPKHKFEDKDYERERSELTEKVSSAVEQGFKAAASTSGVKRKETATATAPATKKKKTCLWTDIDDLGSSCSESDVEESEAKCEDVMISPAAGISSSNEEDSLQREDVCTSSFEGEGAGSSVESENNIPSSSSSEGSENVQSSDYKEDSSLKAELSVN